MIPSRSTFAPQERRFLLLQTGVSIGMVDRLEEIGYRSIAQLQAAGVAQVVREAEAIGTPGGWANRHRALARAIQEWEAQTERVAA